MKKNTLHDIYIYNNKHLNKNIMGIEVNVSKDLIDRIQEKTNKRKDVLPKDKRKRYYLENIAKRRAYQREYYYKNREAVKEYQRKYREANREVLREKQRVFQKENKDKVREYQKNYRQNKTADIKAYHREYYRKNRTRLLAMSKENRRKRMEEINNPGPDPKYKRISINGKRMYYHRYIWEKHNGPIPKGHIIHHKNGNIHDNRPRNLQCVSRKQHREIHLKEQLKSNSRSYYGKMSKQWMTKNREYWNNYQREYKAKHREMGKKYYQENRERIRAYAKSYYQKKRKEKCEEQ